MAVSTSKDGRFKTWVVVDSEASGREEKRTKGGTHSSWACRSVGYYLDLPCYNAAFCEDGSLLALNFHKVGTLSHFSLPPPPVSFPDSTHLCEKL